MGIHGTSDASYNDIHALMNIFTMACDDRGNYLLYPNDATNQMLVLQFPGFITVLEVILVNTHNGASRDRFGTQKYPKCTLFYLFNRGTREFSIETSIDVSSTSWDMFAEGTLSDPRNDPCPQPKQAFTSANKDGQPTAKFLKLTSKNYYGAGSGWQSISISGSG